MFCFQLKNLKFIKHWNLHPIYSYTNIPWTPLTEHKSSRIAPHHQINYNWFNCLVIRYTDEKQATSNVWLLISDMSIVYSSLSRNIVCSVLLEGSLNFHLVFKMSVRLLIGLFLNLSVLAYTSQSLVGLNLVNVFLILSFNHFENLVCFW